MHKNITYIYIHMNSINLLAKSIKLNLNNNVKNILNILENYNGNDWKKFIKYSNLSNYKRNTIYQDTEFEIVIITWNKNSKSEIHDHSKNGCALKLLQGNLIEEIYDLKLNKIKSESLLTNNISFINNNIGYHKIINQNELSVSMHIYSPPNYISENIFINSM
jgi:cysteine dioxygenase